MRATRESGCCWAGADAPVRNSAPRYRNLSGRHNDKSPWPIPLRRDWAVEIEQFRLPAALLHVGQPLVGESLSYSRAPQRMIKEPNLARTWGPTEPLLLNISER